METYMYETNEKYIEDCLKAIRDGGMLIWPDLLAVFIIQMRKLLPTDDRSYQTLKDVVRPEWFKDHVINPNFVEMN